jgi:hypothetical protein
MQVLSGGCAMKTLPNNIQHEAYSKAFGHFNKTLFSGTLPLVMLTLTRDEQALKGYYMPDAWHDEKENSFAEISLNANSMKDDVYFLLNVLIHEMVHLWQFTFGSPDKGSHNEEFAVKCEELGLVFTNDRTGQAVQTEIGDTGEGESCKALDAMASLPEEAIFPYMSKDKGTSTPPKWHPIPVPVPAKPKPRKPRAKKVPLTNYACPICGVLASAKPKIFLLCGECDEPLIEEVGK